MNLENIRNNKVKTILQFSIPSIIAMVLTSLISVTDGFFVGNYVGEEGLTAINLGLPIIYLFLAVGLMISVGGVSNAGMALGGKKIKKCNSIFNQTICTTIIAAIILSIIIFFCFEPILNLLKANAEVKKLFKDYYTIMLLQLPIMIINTSFGMFIRGEGNPQYFMNINVLNVILNIILDYLFVRWFDCGIKGIAFSSLIAGITTLLLNLHFFIKVSKVYKIGKFKFSKEILKLTMFNGSSEFISEMSMSISMFAYNFVILRNIGVNGVTAFTIIGYIAYIFNMILVGFGQGLSPLSSFTYGAKDYLLAKKLRKITNIMVLIAGAVVLLLVIILSKWYSTLFVKNDIIQEMVRCGMMVYGISFMFSGINTITSFYFTSIGKAKESAIISSSRGLVVLLICIFTLPQLLGITGVYLVSPITEFLTLFLSIFFITKEYSKNKI